MASKRQERWRSCEKKIKHDTSDQAHAHKRHLSGRYSVYKCTFCGGWHVGRTTKKVKQAMAARQARKW